MADDDDDDDSLAPHIAAIARSKRFWAFTFSVARIIVPLVGGSLVVPAFQWCASRYGRTDAEALTARVTTLERLVGLPPPAEVEREKAVRDRVLQLELRLRDREQAALEREHAIYAGLITAAARSKVAAHEALESYERDCKCTGIVGSEVSPYRCARSPSEAALGYLAPR